MISVGIDCVGLLCCVDFWLTLYLWCLQCGFWFVYLLVCVVCWCDSCCLWVCGFGLVCGLGFGLLFVFFGFCELVVGTSVCRCLMFWVCIRFTLLFVFGVFLVCCV